MNRSLPLAAFVVGLAAVCWVGAGYVGTNWLALAVTLLILAFYLVGALELRRFQASIDGLSQALADLPDPLGELGPFLARVPLSMRNAVRLRIEGERVGLPSPALVSYLTGLLVLLGMLGTFLGMVVTLKGTGLALETAKDLQGIRAELSGPVRGLGLAFGTSIAGVAASAMLGLMASLVRRDALLATQALDTRMATSLRPFSPVHRREETFRLLQRQAEVMPALVDRLQAMIGAVERQGELLNERLIDSHERFHGKAEAAYAGLAGSVDRSLKATLVESARIAGTTIQPIVEATMAAIAREAGALHENVARDAAELHRQVSGGAAALHERLSSDMAALTSHAARDAAALHEAAARGATALFDSVSRDASTLREQAAREAAGLHEKVAHDAAELHRRVAQDAAELHRGVSAEATALQRNVALEATALARDVAKETTTLAQGVVAETAALAQGVARDASALQHKVAAELQRHVDGLSARFEAATVRSAELWEGALGRHQGASEAVTADLRLTVDRIAATFETHSAALLDEVGRSAAHTIGELRERLAESLAGDNAMLEERQRVMQTLATLMDAATRASTEQRAAIEAMVGSTTALMERAGLHFTQKAGEAGETLATAAAEITGSAVEVASLGEAFGVSVQLFGQSNEKLVAQLQGIERALGKSLARSDDQLAYYVAQAREVIDLSLMSQKQIVEDLQQIAGKQAAVTAS